MRSAGRKPAIWLVGVHYSLLTVKRLRPLARRRLRTRRPFFELIRTRNPWVFTRWRLFGWNVRFPFMCQSLRENRASDGNEPLQEGQSALPVFTQF